MLPLLVTLYGCPYSSPYKLDDTPATYVDDRILGEWLVTVNNNFGTEDMKMLISRRDEREYFIHFTGIPCNIKPFFRASTDTIQALAFISIVADKEVLNLEISGQTFLAEIIFKNEKLFLLPISDHFTSKIVRNNSELRTALEVHYRTRLRPMYDDEFCLRDITRLK